MLTLFVSCQDVDEPRVRELIERLRAEDVDVRSSPRNPSRGFDEAWSDWYAVGLDQALDGVDAFVIVVDSGWDSSTWMGEEARRASQRLANGGDPPMFFVNPSATPARSSSMEAYLRIELPAEPMTLVSTLEAHLRRRRPHGAA